ncbi:MAG: T9SS type A sorting domain-containing protein [Bacteroidales bacterium]
MKKIYILFFFLTLGNFLFAQTEIDAQGEQGGKTWSGVVNITGDVIVKTGLLKIEAGTKVNFKGHYRFQIDEIGYVQALGAENDSIRFTAENQEEGWNGLVCYNLFSIPKETEKSTFDYCIFEYSKKTGDNYEDNKGGCLAIINWSKICFSNSHFKKNECVNNGGAVFVDVPALFENCIFSENQAPEYGGAVYSTDVGGVFKGCTFKKNSSKNNGGAISILQYGKIENCKFIENISEKSGGGVYVSVNADVKGSEFKKNTSISSGGGLYALGNISIDNCLFEENKASSFGGGANIKHGNLKNSTFTKNESSKIGGGLLTTGNAFVFNCTFTENIAKQNGGGLAFMSTAEKATFKYCKVYSNTSVNSGGGLYINGKANAEYCISANNNAQSGGGVYLTKGAGLKNSVVYNNETKLFGGGISSREDTKIYNVTVANNYSKLGGTQVYHSGKGDLANLVIYGDDKKAVQVYGTGMNIHHCAIQGGYTGDGAGENNINLSSANSGAGDGNFVKFIKPVKFIGRAINENKDKFQELLDANWNVESTSVIIDKGDNSVMTSRFDFLGLRRTNGIVDLGAFENNDFSFSVNYEKETTLEKVSRDFAMSTSKDFEEIIKGKNKVLSIEPSKTYYFKFQSTNNGAVSPVFELKTDDRPKSPENFKLSKEKLTISFDINPDYTDLAKYEYTVNAGTNWSDVSANPILLEKKDYAAKAIQVRLKGSNEEGKEHFASLPLIYESAIEFEVSLEENNIEKSFAHPNPTEGGIYVQSNEGAVIQIVTLKGTVVYTGKANSNSYYMDLSSLEKGVYILKKRHNSKTECCKIIIK